MGNRRTTEATEDPGRTQLRFRLISIGFAIGAAYHIAAIVLPRFSLSGGSFTPWWRDALFTIIDLALGYAALKRPPILIPAMFLLLLQQLSTHGVRLWHMAAQGRIDWLSALVLVFLVFSLVTLILDRRSTHAASPPLDS
jgi:hypothetical protein